MFVDPTPWMPASMDAAQKKAYADQYPYDPHRAAAEAWEWYAAVLEPDPGIVHASTGQQSVTYAQAKSAFTQAEKRAAWHRARSKPLSVPAYAPAADLLTDGDD